MSIDVKKKYLNGNGDLDYDTAYAIARQAILDTFGTPEAELDAMVSSGFSKGHHSHCPAAFISTIR